MHSFACVVAEKNFPQKMELSPNFLQTFACVATEKKTFLKKWSSHQISCKCKIFLMAVYMIFKYSKRFRFAPSFNNYTESTKQMEETLNFQVPAEGLELVILLHTQY